MSVHVSMRPCRRFLPYLALELLLIDLLAKVLLHRLVGGENDVVLVQSRVQGSSLGTVVDEDGQRAGRHKSIELALPLQQSS